ncbi:uncharacterized protein LOC105006817 isoform X4 [Esox lucius]|uniref:uncharacterized protein LOC105006817 isoform X4 n=1 Tax=Esox lucius TaxID=8010 RepID=UPI0010BCEEC5|nr:uncharacterized protein LOC105006817 isoform X4 [Esox lucius]
MPDTTEHLQRPRREGDSSTMRILDMNEEDTYDKEKIGILQKYSVYFQWCWWKRPPRVTALFLGSYVLLLAVIIGLSVHFNNRHYYAETMLQTSYKNLTKEKDQLKKNIEWLKSKIKVNLALNGVAVQSSPYGGVQASNAIDGERTSHYYSGSCTHTQEDTNPWWRVDLGDVYRVTTVMITNRKDCCAERLNGAELRIGNSLENNGTTNSRCAVISHIPAGETKAFQCKDMEGRYVVVVIPGRAEWLTLCEVEVYGSHAVSLALNGVAAQSSLYGNHKASDAIDGDRTSHYDSGSCTQTKKDTNPWWRVDLKGLYRVRTVSLTNRGDCCPERLDGAEIRIGNSLENNGINNPRCAVISHIPAGETKAFQCNEMEGRYVVVVIPGRAEWLTLCEVEVYGSHAVNLALNGVAAQSSLYGNHKASDAIDGDRTSHYDSGSCTHTQKDTNPWWRVDLGDVYRVRTVSLTNRGDCCPERLDGAEIRIGNSLENNGINNPRCAVISNIPAGETHYFQCNEMEGRYVVVVIPGRAEWLTLCEVEVYGLPTVNLALNGVAAQSSLYFNTKASDAIDGDTTSNYHSGSCTHTQKDNKPWWRVDLRETYRIRSVSLTNRGDCCEERLDGAEIRIGNSLENNGINNPRCAVISNIPAGETHYFQCNEMEGRYVVVVIPGREEFLTLCEVEVYGSPTVNLALNGVAAQSSLKGNRNASDAIDGDRTSHYGSCTHTQKDTNPWWRVDLRDVYRVTTVSLTNRGDCCPERLDGAEIRIGNSLENNGINNPRCAVISNIPAGETHYFQCNEMEGRYVVVVIPGREEFLTLCEVEVYGSPPVNLALNGVATQSSLYTWKNKASDAIDGDRDSNYLSGSCAFTGNENKPWWRVDLKDVYSIRSVSLTNRGDCCPERLNGAEIRIGNSLENNGIKNPRCAVISNIPAGETKSFQCNGMEGRYVVVVIPGRAEFLTLCEVEVYGSPTVNLALNGVAAQSSLYGNRNASDAIDGDRTSHYHSGSCTHTQKDTNPWWRVDLRDVYRVRTVSLTNRGDCCPERLDGAEIRIGNSLENNGINNTRCAVISNIPAGETQSFQCNEMEGRYVVVVIPGRAEFLTLCEVEVYGSPAVNLALNGVAAQSSLYGNRNASDAIDGDRTSHYHSGSCTHTQKDTNPWWRVDLRDEYRVRSVSLTNRGDCCPERLDGAEIRIGNSLENNGINNTRCAVISNIPAGETHYFQCNEMEGRYVVVVIPGRAEFLTLCEVEIYGSPPVNLALKGKAAQSSSPFQNGRAFKAIDGDRDSHYDSGSCTQTKKDTNPWWRVDLKGLYRVRSVSLTNRGDCCPERLDGAEIRIGNSLENNGINNSRCAVISHIPAGETHYFQCNEMEGRYVVVVIPGREEFLTLCEVEVYGSPTVNLALNGVAAQSSLYGNRNASDAIDGDRTSHYGSCTHTQKDTNPWWRVDLRDEYRVRTVSLTNRGDCCPERLDGAEIRIGNSLENNGINNTRCAVISHIPAGETHYFQCNEMEGRYVVVVIPGRAEWLTLCEVEIYGSPKGKPML